MKKVLFGIFAHPDDEGFGPSGTLHKLAQNGTAVHLILVTDGAASTNHTTNKDLAATRLKEWRASGTLIGASNMRALGYPDGQLSNNLYLEITEKIIHYIKTIVPTDEKATVDFMTFDQNGLSGHLDHIAVSFITTFVYLKLREEYHETAVNIDQLKYFCLPETLATHANTNWLFMPAGRKLEDIDEIVDITDVYQKKLEIMAAHHSQQADMEMILQRHAHLPDFKREHFVYYQ